MFVRGFADESLADNGGSAFTQNCRSALSEIFAIWPFASFAKNDAKKIAENASVVRMIPAVMFRLFIIRATRKAVLQPTTPQPVLNIDVLPSMHLPYYGSVQAVYRAAD